MTPLNERQTGGCGCPYDEHDPWCPTFDQPPTEREGLRVGDAVLLVPHGGRGPWPARIVEFQRTDACCMVVEWTGLRPFTGSDRNTICRKHLLDVLSDDTPPAASASASDDASECKHVTWPDGHPTPLGDPHGCREDPPARSAAGQDRA